MAMISRAIRCSLQAGSEVKNVRSVLILSSRRVLTMRHECQASQGQTSIGASWNKQITTARRMFSSCPARLRDRVILGIESSCDDSCASVVSAPASYASAFAEHEAFSPSLLSSVVLSQDHSRTGGIEPLTAAHGHGANVPRAVRMALEQAGLEANAGGKQIDAIAVTQGPGMAGCLNVGLTTAKTLSALWSVPIIYCHHMAAHALTPLLTGASLDDRPRLPFLTLLLSGGHTLLVLVRSFESFSVLASSDDISIGDAFDKVARHLGLEWSKAPGKDLEMFAAEAAGMDGDVASTQGALEFPVAMRGLDGFSYSGLHTAVEDYLKAQKGDLTESHRRDVARAFQRAAFGQVEDKLRMYLGPEPRGRRKRSRVKGSAGDFVAVDNSLGTESQAGDTEGHDGVEIVAPRDKASPEAMDASGIDKRTGSQRLWAERTQLVQGVRHIVVSGGVAANKELRRNLQRRLDKLGRSDIQLIFPPLDLCTDNAAMIAHLGHLLWHRRTMELDAIPRAKWSLDDL